MSEEAGSAGAGTVVAGSAEAGGVEAGSVVAGSAEAGSGARVMLLPTPRERALVERALAQVDPLVASFARKYAGLFDAEDAASTAKIGAMEVVRRYDEAQDAHFDAYAAVRIRGILRSFVRSEAEQKRTVREVWRAAELAQAYYQLDYNIVVDSDDKLRGLGRDFAADIAAAGFAGGVSAASRGAPKDEAEREESVYVDAMLRESVEGLPPEEGQVIAAVYCDGMELKEVAQRLGVSYITVRRRFARARPKLRKALVKRGVSYAPEPCHVPGLPPVLPSVKDELEAIWKRRMGNDGPGNDGPGSGGPGSTGGPGSKGGPGSGGLRTRGGGG